MVFVVGKNKSNGMNQFFKNYSKTTLKEVAAATSSYVYGVSVITAQAGIQYFNDSCLRRNDNIVVGGQK